LNLVLMTQYFDTLKEIGASSETNTILIPHSPGNEVISWPAFAFQWCLAGSLGRNESLTCFPCVSDPAWLRSGTTSPGRDDRLRVSTR
jgi:hypothetical protein